MRQQLLKQLNEVQAILGALKVTLASAFNENRFSQVAQTACELQGYTRQRDTLLDVIRSLLKEEEPTTTTEALVPPPAPTSNN